LKRACKTGPQSNNDYAEGAGISFEHFDEFTSPDSVSIRKRIQGAGFGSFSCYLRSKRRVSSFAVT
jgi:hypothetical protein